MSGKVPEAILQSDEAARAVEGIRRAVDPETLDEAATDFLHAAVPHLHKAWSDELREQLAPLFEAIRPVDGSMPDEDWGKLDALAQEIYVQAFSTIEKGGEG